ncbi:hypothetical protein EVC45_26505 [Paraburkholderia sp. UYCP14C]|nr:hypothetical protein EVC45_26505 [Paraburkholderia sp. UYCP14C]
MPSAGKSLRLMVEHWLAPDSESRLRVAEFRNRRSPRECYVCIEKSTTTGSLSIYFYRHHDGTWRVFPPDPQRLTMRAR